jgi:hypothetical protein
MSKNTIINGQLTFLGSIAGQVAVQAQSIGGDITLNLPNSIPASNQALIATSVNGSAITLGWGSGGSGGGAGGTVDEGLTGQLAYYATTGSTIDGTIYAIINGGSLSLGGVSVAGQVTLYGLTGNTVAISGVEITTSYTLTLPSTPGSSGQILTTDGTGILNWQTVTGTGTVSNVFGSGIATGSVTASGAIQVLGSGSTFTAATATTNVTTANANDIIIADGLGNIQDSGVSVLDVALTVNVTTAIGAETSRAEAAEALLAPKNNPTFTGTVTLPGGTYAISISGNAATATTAGSFSGTIPQAQVTGLTSALALLAPINAPTFTGTVSGITYAMVGADQAGAATTAQTNAQNFATASIVTAISTEVTNRNAAISTAVGTETSRATAAEALLAPKNSPTFTGTVVLPNATYAISISGNAATATTAGSYSGTVTQAQVTGLTSALALLAPLANPTFTGTVTLPNATYGINISGNAATANSASTAGTITGTVPYSQVSGAPNLSLYALLSNATFTGTVVLPNATYAISISGNAGTANTAITASNLSGTPLLPNGVQAVTQLPGNNTNNLATTAFVANAVSGLTSAVVSVFGRTGTVIAQTGDYSFAQISGSISTGQVPLLNQNTTGTAANLTAAVSLPTGTAVATTPTAGDSSTKIATTAFVATSYAPLAGPTFTGTATFVTNLKVSGTLTDGTGSVGSGTQVLSTTGGTGVKWINAGSGTVTSVSGGGIATGSFTTSGTITVTGSSTNSKTVAVTDAGSIAGASSGFVVTTDGNGNVQNSTQALSGLALTAGPTFSGTATFQNIKITDYLTDSLSATGTLNQVLTVGSSGYPTWANNPAGFANPMTTSGDVIFENATPAPSRLPIGSTGQVLTVVGGLPAWENNPAGFANPMTTAGDIIFESSTPAPSRLPIGSTNQVLTVSGGLPVWAAPGAASSLPWSGMTNPTGNMSITTGTDLSAITAGDFGASPVAYGGGVFTFTDNATSSTDTSYNVCIATNFSASPAAHSYHSPLMVMANGLEQFQVYAVGSTHVSGVMIGNTITPTAAYNSGTNPFSKVWITDNSTSNAGLTLYEGNTNYTGTQLRMITAVPYGGAGSPPDVAFNFFECYASGTGSDGWTGAYPVAALRGDGLLSVTGINTPTIYGTGPNFTGTPTILGVPIATTAYVAANFAPQLNASFTGTTTISNVYIEGTFKDSFGEVGTSGQVLSCSGPISPPESATGVKWINAGTGSVTSISTSGIATGGPITSTGTVTVLGSGNTTTAVTDQGSIQTALIGWISITDGNGNLRASNGLTSTNVALLNNGGGSPVAVTQTFLAGGTTFSGNPSFTGTPTFSNTITVNISGNATGLSGTPNISVNTLTANTIGVSSPPTTTTLAGNFNGSPIFSGNPLFTGNPVFSNVITGNITGSSGSCTGNAATVTGLSVAGGKTLTVQNSLILAGTDTYTYTFPNVNSDVVTLINATQTLSNKSLVSPGLSGTIVGNPIFAGGGSPASGPTFSGTPLFESSVTHQGSVTFQSSLISSGSSLVGNWGGNPTFTGNPTFSGTPTFGIVPTLPNQAAATAFMGPATGTAAAPTFRVFVSTDIPAINLATSTNGGVTGNLPVTNLAGGTNASSSTFWCGNGTWTAVSSGGSGTVYSGAPGQLAYYPGSPDATTAVAGAVDASISGGALTLGSTSSVAGSLVLAQSNSAFTTAIAASSIASTSSWVFRLPPEPPTSSPNESGYVLSSDTNGNTSWVAPGSVSSTAWSALTAPTANLSLSTGLYTSAFTAGSFSSPPAYNNGIFTFTDAAASSIGDQSYNVNINTGTSYHNPLMVGCNGTAVLQVYNSATTQAVKISGVLVGSALTPTQVYNSVDPSTMWITSKDTGGISNTGLTIYQDSIAASGTQLRINNATSYVAGSPPYDFNFFTCSSGVTTQGNGVTGGTVITSLRGDGLFTTPSINVNTVNGNSTTFTGNTIFNNTITGNISGNSGTVTGLTLNNYTLSISAGNVAFVGNANTTTFNLPNLGSGNSTATLASTAYVQSANLTPDSPPYSQYLQTYNATTGVFTWGQPTFGEIASTIATSQMLTYPAYTVSGAGSKVQLTVGNSTALNAVVVYDSAGNVQPYSNNLLAPNIVTNSTSSGGVPIVDYIQPITVSTILSVTQTNGVYGFGPKGQMSTLILATAGNLGIQLTLPSANIIAGHIIKVIMTDQGGSTVNSPPGTAGVTILSSASIGYGTQYYISPGVYSYELTNQNESVTLEYIGSIWVITATAN